MSAKFHERFEIAIGTDEARRRFVNRVSNKVYRGFFESTLHEAYQNQIVRRVANALGEPYHGDFSSIDDFAGSDFLKNLQTIEVLYAALTDTHNGRAALDKIVTGIVRSSEADIGVRWESGRFLPSGAPLLDDGLVNEPLRWLKEARFATVLAPFQKGLEHLMHATRRPEFLSDVITDMYEAIEALAKIVTGREKDLSANRELFVQAVGASPEYKTLLKDYIAYANSFRHGAGNSKPKPSLTEAEVESFVYLTGVFVRLAMKSAPVSS